MREKRMRMMRDEGMRMRDEGMRDKNKRIRMMTTMREERVRE
jgi:hypothetical protein